MCGTTTLRSSREGLQPPYKHIAREWVLSDEKLANVLKHATGKRYPFGPIVGLLILIEMR
jgi:hypothetical protein